jgi:hypothetical protein
MKYLLLMYADPSIGADYSEEDAQAAAKTWAGFRKEIDSAACWLRSCRNLAERTFLERRLQELSNRSFLSPQHQ